MQAQDAETDIETADAAGGRSARRRRAILSAATEAFLQSGYPSASVDEIAAASRASKQTIYKQFGSKEALFIEVVLRLTNSLSNAAPNKASVPTSADEVAAYLRDYGLRQLLLVLDRRSLQLRRMVIGELSRFPKLGQALYEVSPDGAMKASAAVLEALCGRGLLAIEDPAFAAMQFNWLVMGEPLNKAMFLGHDATTEAMDLRRHVGAAVSIFMAAYAAPEAPSQRPIQLGVAPLGPRLRRGREA